MLWLLSAIVILGLCGVVLLAVGIRGRLVNTHPHCRRCRFDLVGHTSPDGSWSGRVCPECGSDLAAAGAIRIGIRAARRPALFAGLAILLFVGLVSGGAIWTIARGTNAYVKAPTWLLIRGLGVLKANQTDLAAQELRARNVAGLLSNSNRHAIAEAALRVQGDVSLPMSIELGKFIEDVHTAGQLSSEQWNAYLDHAEVLSLSVRPKIASGDPLPMELILLDRLGRTGLVQIRVWVVDVIVDGVRIDGGRHEISKCPNERTWSSPSGVPSRLPTLPQSFAKLRTSPWTPAIDGWDDLAITGERGTHTVETVWAVVVGPQLPGKGHNSWSYSPWNSLAHQQSARHTTDDEELLMRERDFTDMLTHGYDKTRFQPSDDHKDTYPELRAKMVRLRSTFEIASAEAVQPRVVDAPTDIAGNATGLGANWESELWSNSTGTGPPDPKPRLHLTIRQPYPQVAGDVFEITHAGEVALGSMVAEHVEIAAGQYSMGAWFPIPLTGDWVTPRTFVFRPSAEAAKRLVREGAIIGSEVLFENVPPPDMSHNYPPVVKETVGRVRQNGKVDHSQP